VAVSTLRPAADFGEPLGLVAGVSLSLGKPPIEVLGGDDPHSPGLRGREALI
jgi:hypothetical protein